MKGAKLAIPGVVDLSEVAAAAGGVAKIVLESVRSFFSSWRCRWPVTTTRRGGSVSGKAAKLAKAAGKYIGRAPDLGTHRSIIALRSAG